jgi:lysophospholipase L1-like esterase
MKTILCYGDSNTYGYIPGSEGARYDRKIRWPGALRRILNEGRPPGERAWWVVEEGLNGRTTCRDDPFEPYRNGLAHIVPILKSHKPLDAVAVMLGTNDAKRRFNPSPFDIAEGMLLLVRAIQHSETGPGERPPQILVISPPHIVQPETNVLGDIFDGSLAIVQRLAPYYRKIARIAGAGFYDAAKAIRSSPVDGVHLEPEEHQKLAAAVSEAILAMPF